jgi:hypothetical protein
MLKNVKTATWGGVKAEYTDLTRLEDPCDVPGEQIASQLESDNALISAFLEKTNLPKTGTWTQAQIDEAKRAQEVVTPVVDAADNSIQALSSHCPFLPPAIRLQDAQKRGRDLIFPARQRLMEIPKQIAKQQHALDVAKWKEAQTAAIQQAHDTWCPPKPRPRKMPDIYYAAQDENGRTAWLFCDGAKVITSEGGAPEYIPAPGRRYHRPAAYLSSATNFPTDEIKHAPKMTRVGWNQLPDTSPKPPDPTAPKQQ